jgi:transposase InsO family protein
VPIEVEELAVRVRKELADEGWDCGAVTVRHRLAELGITAPAVSTLHRIFVRRGLVVPQPQKRPRSADRRFAFALVDECWQVDAYDWALSDGTPCAVFNHLDDCSRTLSSWAAVGETSVEAINATRAAIDRWGQVPCFLLSDNGTALNQSRRGRTSQLSAFLQALGCKPISGRPDHPQTQGKDERVHQTQQRWLRAHPAADALSDLQALLNRFDDYYNDRRPHQELGMRTPNEVRTTQPRAVAPLPVAPTAEPAVARVTVRRLRISTNGNLRVDAMTIRIDPEHAGRSVAVLQSPDTLTIFDDQGVHFRTVHLEPGKRYYSNGRPRGRRPKAKRPD